jgi:catechol 2,3-dioxygenase-like lactoylglutathione lyase family enzyme
VPRLTGLAPVLLVPDVAQTLAWYRDVLDCEVEAWSEEPEAYGYATRDGCTIHVARAERARPNAELVPPDLFDVYIWVDDVRALHEQLVERGADVLHSPTERPWRMLEIRVRDLNGYVLGIGEPRSSAR